MISEIFLSLNKENHRRRERGVWFTSLIFLAILFTKYSIALVDLNIIPRHGNLFEVEKRAAALMKCECFCDYDQVDT